MKIKIIHTVCGKPAFLYERDGCIPGSMLMSKSAEHLDGRRMFDGDQIVCDSCGEVVAWEHGYLTELRPEL
jgi:hypothetical protein